MYAPTEPLRPLRALNPQEAKVSDLVDLLVPWFHHLAESSVIEPGHVPSDDEVAQWTAALFTDHGGRLRVRRSPAKGASDVERAVHGVFRWHGSGGSLEGLFIAKFNAGEAFDRVDTYVSVLLVASGRRSSALAAWQRTGLFPSTEEV